MLTTLIAVSVLAQTPPQPPPADVTAPAPLVQADAPPAPPPAPPAQPAPAPVVEVERFAPKMRFGVGSLQGFNVNSNDIGALGLLGGYLRVGWQFTERWGSELEGGISTIGFSTAYRGIWWVNFTANDWFSFGLGAMLGHNNQDIPNLFDGPDIHAAINYGAAVGRIDFTVVSSHNETGGRKAFTLGLEVEVGQTFGTATGGSEEGAYLTCGFAYW